MPGTARIQLTNFADHRLPLAHLVREGGREPLGFRLDLPWQQLSTFARDVNTGGPLAKLPLYALAEIGPVPGTPLVRRDGEPDDEAARARATLRYPLGLLATDHAGYASFDLTVLHGPQVFDALHDLLGRASLVHPDPKDQVTVGITRLLVLPFGDPSIAFDALAEGDLGPTYVSLRMPFDQVMLAGRVTELPSVAMQNPGILDWRLSPGSFSMAGALLVGEDGCETLLPTNLASQMFRFRQIARSAATTQAEGGTREHRQVWSARLGFALSYQAEWFPVGHSLGQIVSSLPLAPGEKIKMAVVDWDRTDRAQRAEDTALAEHLVHDQLRDRSLTESVAATVNEFQHGSSFMAGGALSAGASVPVGGVDLGVGGAFSMGGASADSSGHRDLSADTTQHIADAFHQTSSALRELHSTVVVQGEQAERASAHTRVVVNYNHSHALTLLYYEVLRHYRVLTRYVSRRAVLMLTQPLVDFTGVDLLIDHRRALEAALLDPEVKSCFDAVARLQCLTWDFERAQKKAAEGPSPLDDTEVGQVTMRVTSGPHGAPWNTTAQLMPKSGPPVHGAWTDASITMSDPGSAYLSDEEIASWFRSGLIPANAEFIASFTPKQRITWNNVAGVVLGQTLGGHIEGPVNARWDVAHLRFTTETLADRWVMYDGKPVPDTIGLFESVQVVVQPFKPVPKDPFDLLTDEERCCVTRLRRHLMNNQLYYSRAIWLAEDAGQRMLRLAGLTLADTPLWDIADNELYEIIGDQIVVPVAVGRDAEIARAFDVRLAPDDDALGFVEQLLTLPTRGVFAEAKLGHCNASEVIDSTRFWDWQTSPIPEDTPEIAPVTTDKTVLSPGSTTPTPFPASIVNIASPQALPDPAGLGTAAAMMAALGAFRDMSGLKEVGSLTETLSNNATQLASQGLKQQGTKSLMDMIRGSGELSPAQKTDLISSLLTGQVRQASTSPSTPVAPAPATPSDPPKPGDPPPVTSPKPTPPPMPEPVPPPAAKPAKPAVLTGKTRRLTFLFSFDTGQPMAGEYQVELLDTQTGRVYTPAADPVRTSMVFVDLPASVTSGVAVTITGTVHPTSFEVSGALNPAQWSLSVFETVQFASLAGVTGFNVVGQGKDVSVELTFEKSAGSEWSSGSSNEGSVSIKGGGGLAKVVELSAEGGYKYVVTDDTTTTQGQKDVRVVKLTVRELDRQKQPKIDAVK